MPFSDTVDPTQDTALMIALGSLVVRSAELEKDVGELLARLCGPKTKTIFSKKSLT